MLLRVATDVYGVLAEQLGIFPHVRKPDDVFKQARILVGFMMALPVASGRGLWRP